MQLDLRKTFESLKVEFPNIFQNIGEFDSLTPEQAQEFLTNNFTEQQLLKVNADFLNWSLNSIA